MKDKVIHFKPALKYIDCPGFDKSKYEDFRGQIIKSFEQYYLSCVDLMDEDDEIRIEAKEQYEAIQIGNMSKHTDIITNHLKLMWESVCGNLDHYYGADSEDAILLKSLAFPPEEGECYRSCY